MAGYVFAVSKESWNDFCSENLKHGHFSPYTPQITEELQNNNRSRKSLNKVISAVFGDMITMKPGDNVYFFSNRKIYGIGELVCVGNDCKYDNYLNASSLLPNFQIELQDVLTDKSSRARWVSLNLLLIFLEKGRIWMISSDIGQVHLKCYVPLKICHLSKLMK